VRPVEQHAARPRVGLQDRREQRPLAAADVDHRPGAGEVVGGEHGRDLRRAAPRHRLVEDARLLRVGRQVLEQGRAEGVVEGGLAGAEAVEDAAP
jgi:hypothetical protein